MDACTTPNDNNKPVLDEFVEGLLVGWSGLRLYLNQRRAGCPRDNTMETLLSELLRVNFGDRVDTRSVIGQLEAPPSA